MRTSIAILMCLMTGRAMAHDPSAFEKWFDAAWAEARAGVLPAGYLYAFNVEQHATYEAGEAENVPPGEAARELPLLKAGGAITNAFRVWAGEGNVLRVSQDPGKGAVSGEWWDFANNGKDEVWQLWPKSLRVTGKDHPAWASAAGTGDLARDNAGRFLWGGLGIGGSAKLEVKECVQEARAWHVRAVRSRDGYSFEYAGDWDEQAKQGVVRVMRIARADGVAALAIRAEGWRLDERLGRMVAATVAEENERGRVTKVFKELNVSLVSAGEMASLVAVPGEQRADAIRGRITTQRVFDDRGTKSKFVTDQAAVLERGLASDGGAWSVAGPWIGLGAWVVGAPASVIVSLLMWRRAERANSAR